MDKKTITINDEKFGKCFFVKDGNKIFVILSEIIRCFGYNPVSGHNKSRFTSSSILKKSIVKFNLHGTEYYEYLASSGHFGKLRSVCSKSCIEINNFIDYLNNSKQSGSHRKNSVKKFLLDNFQSINKHKELPKFFESTSQNTASDPFDNLSNEISSLKNKFKLMQINLDSMKEQIDAKDKSIIVLRAKIKELEEQNALLDSQLENQTRLNKSIGSLVSEWTALNNVTA